MVEDQPKLALNYDWTVVSKTILGITSYMQAHNPDCKGIHFQGEGWYRGGEETLLIIAEDDRWRLFGWRGRDPRPVFQQLLALENCYEN